MEYPELPGITILKVIDDLQIREIDDEIIIFNPKNRAIHSINHSGSLIFKLCNGINRIEDIRIQVSHIFKIQDKSIYPDIDVFLSKLLEFGLIKDETNKAA